LKAFVVGDDPSAATTSQIIEAGLAGYAVSRLTGTAAVVDERLTRARVTLAARHLTSKAVFSKLLTAWVDAGLEVLVFKGFALAEFTYPDPTWRTYSDIDVALRPPPGLDWSDLARVAAKVAVDNGFTVLGRPDVSDTFDSLFGESYHGPALIQVVHDRSQLNIDVHCRVVHNNHVEDTNVTKQAAITDAVWRDSRAISGPFDTASISGSMTRVTPNTALKSGSSQHGNARRQSVDCIWVVAITCSRPSASR